MTVPIDAVEQRAAEHFGQDTAGHQIAVLHEEGLYRHLRFKHPKRGAYWFDLITWPGVLVINGDMGSYTFSRITDMFEFFRSKSGRINPHYWAQKLRANDGVRAYSEDLFRRRVTEAFVDAVRYGAAPRGLGKAVRRDILDSTELGWEESARQVLDRFAFYKNESDRWDIDKAPDFQFEDTWEWDFSEYTHQFLWSCHAIVWGIAQYDAKNAAVIVEAAAAGRAMSGDAA